MEERIDRHIYQYVEAELRNYKTYVRLIDEYDKEYQGAKSGLGKDITGRFSQNKTSDSTSSEALKMIGNENRINRAKDIVNCIDDIFDNLGEEDKRLIELKYIQGLLTDWGVSRELHLSLRTFYRRKNSLVKRFALRMRLL